MRAKRAPASGILVLAGALLLGGGAAARAQSPGAVHDPARPGAGAGAPDAAGDTVAEAPAPVGSPGRQVITAREIREAGITRLEDLIGLADGWRRVTTDGFTWRASPRGLSSFRRQDWIVLVDGQRVAIDLLGTKSLERLPVAPGEIDSVEVVAGPGAEGGRFADGGVIHLHTLRPDRGLSLRGRAMTGNESGDPGPFRFTDPESRNVHKLGHDFSLVAGAGSERAFVRASTSARRHFATDPANRRRIRSIVPDVAIMDLFAGSLRAGLETDAGSMELLAGRSSREDFLFLPEFGREVPARSRLTYAGVRGAASLPGSLDLEYGAFYDENALRRMENSLDLDFDWALERAGAGAALVRNGPGPAGRLGVRVERRRARTGFALEREGFTLVRADAGARFGLPDPWSASLAGAATVSGGQVAVDLVSRLGWRSGRGTAVRIAVAYAEKLPEEDGRIWQWRRKGYRFLEAAGTRATADGPLTGDRRLDLELALESELGDGFSVGAAGLLRTASGVDLIDQDFRLQPADSAFFSPVGLRTDRSGKVGGAELRLRAVPRGDLVLEASYSYLPTLGGDRLFRAAREEVPDHRLRQTLTYRPVGSLALQAALQVRSGTRWARYRGIGPQTDGRYSAEVPASAPLDLSVQKWLWDGRLRAGLTLRNLFDAAVRYHPIGASNRLSLLFQGEVLLGSM